MFRFSELLCVSALTLSVGVYGSFSESNPNYSYDLSGPELTQLFNSPVYEAERMKRPLSKMSSCVGVICHSGVRVTLGDGRQFLIHKGDRFGISSQTVVTDARHMSSKWESVSTRNFQGTRTVSDFVRVGGPEYNLLLDNCHLGARRMMNQ